MKKIKCQICGKEIEYKTKPPMKCADCKEKKVKKATKFRAPRKGKNGSASSKEGLMFDLLDEVLAGYDYINNGYYSWLISPKKVPMQLDRYYPELKLGFEYDGRQHYIFNSYFHRNKKQFKYLQNCDQLKTELCEKRDVTLIRIKYNKKITKEYLQLKLKEANPNLYNQLFLD